MIMWPETAKRIEDAIREAERRELDYRRVQDAVIRHKHADFIDASEHLLALLDEVTELEQRIEQAKREEETMSSYDNVTLIQLAHDACDIAVGTYKSSSKKYHFKVEKDMAAQIKPGDFLVVIKEDGWPSIVKFHSWAEDFEPLEGIRYVWAVYHLDAASANRLADVDKHARRRMALASAMDEARKAVSEDEQLKMLPRTSVSPNHTYGKEEDVKKSD